MLEAGVFPALLAFGSCDALRASGLADLGRSEEALALLAAAAGWTSEAAWRMLAQLPRMRALTLLILLVCPGARPSASTLHNQRASAYAPCITWNARANMSASNQMPAHTMPARSVQVQGATAGETIRPGGVEVVRGLLSEMLLLPVHKDICADVHAHFQRLVQPTLTAHSRQRCVSMLLLYEVCFTDRGAHLCKAEYCILVFGHDSTLRMTIQIQPTWKRFAPTAQRPIGPRHARPGARGACSRAGQLPGGTPAASGPLHPGEPALQTASTSIGCAGAGCHGNLHLCLASCS